MDGKITQTDLNLAINYMVIERVSKCMGIYDHIVDEYDALPLIFQKAKDGTLAKLFMDLDRQDPNSLARMFKKNSTPDTSSDKGYLATVFEILHNLFGLDGEVLSGARQINLGIGIDKSNPDASKFAKMTIKELYKYIGEHGNAEDEKSGKIKEVSKEEKEKNRNKLTIYDLLPGLNTDDAIERVDNIVKEEIGNIQLSENTSKELSTEVLKWSTNPLGLNTLALYTYLVLNGKIDYEKHLKKSKAEKSKEDKSAEKNYYSEETGDVLDDIFDASFSNIKFTEQISTEKANKKKVTELEWKYTLGWKQNIYCIDSIIYYILRSQKKILEGAGSDGKGATAHKILDKQSLELPYPLVWDAEGSELYQLLLGLWEKDYIFDYSYMELVEESSISAEIDHYINDILPILNSKKEILENRIREIQHKAEAEEHGIEDPDIEDIEDEEELTKLLGKLVDIDNELDDIICNYLPKLEQGQELFDKKRQDWISYMQRTHNDQAFLERVKKRAQAKGAKAVPWIKVKEHYYKHLPIE